MHNLHNTFHVFIFVFRQALHATAEQKLKEERATLTRFDNELKELERVVKDKKEAVHNAKLALQKLEQDVQVLMKEATTVSNFVENLEKQHEWIKEERECVYFFLPQCQ